MAKTIIVSADTFGEGWTKQNLMNTEIYDSLEKLLKSVRYTLNFDTIAVFDIGAAIPANSRINKVVVDVTTAFDGLSESTLTIGDVGDPNRFCTTTEVNLHTIGVYTIEPYHDYSSSTQITGTYNRDGATVGQTYIEIFYSLE